MGNVLDLASKVCLIKYVIQEEGVGDARLAAVYAFAPMSCCIHHLAILLNPQAGRIAAPNEPRYKP